MDLVFNCDSSTYIELEQMLLIKWPLHVIKETYLFWDMGGLKIEGKRTLRIILQGRVVGGMARNSGSVDDKKTKLLLQEANTPSCSLKAQE